MPVSLTSNYLSTTHHSAEEGNQAACQAVMEAAAGPQEGLVGPAVLEAGGCSGPWRWEAFELWEAGALSYRGMAGMEGVAAAVAWDRGTDKKVLRWEEDRGEGRTQAERKKEEVPEVGRNLVQEEAGQRRRQAD